MVSGLSLGNLLNSNVTVNGERREIATQTEESALEHYSPPLSKKLKLYNGEDYGSPCSSATPSEPVELASVVVTPKRNGAVNGTNGSSSWEASTESNVLRGLIKNEMATPAALHHLVVKEEPEDESVEDVINTEHLQNQLMQALFPKNQVSGKIREHPVWNNLFFLFPAEWIRRIRHTWW